jgi:hypothetical protein
MVIRCHALAGKEKPKYTIVAVAVHAVPWNRSRNLPNINIAVTFLQMSSTSLLLFGEATCFVRSEPCQIALVRRHLKKEWSS